MPDRTPQSRRAFLAGSGGALLGSRLFAAETPSYRSETPDMLVSLVAGKLNAQAERWQKERDHIRTAADVEARNRFVREKMRLMMHGFPEKTPLGPVVAASNRREGYRVENVMFQSLPDFWVTGNLYIPDGAGPFPGIISPCGHYPWSRMEPEYQFVYMNFVRAGFVVLAYDPIGQGERRQYWNPRTGRTEVAPSSTYEHSMPGQLLLLMGEDLTHYRVWDGVRAIDYLITRPEVDPKRIGCAGHSGGGTLSMFISAVDERVACSAVNEGGTGHRWPVRTGGGGRMGPSDVEQNLFPAALYGVDSCDMLTAVAPRPLLCTVENYNPNFNSAAEHIRRRYQQLGAGEKFGVEEATDPHSWTMKLRQANTAWFSRWFYNRPGPAKEPAFEPEKPETLYCLADGSVRYSNKGQTIFTLLSTKAEKLPPARTAPPSASEIAAAIKYRKPEVPLGVREMGITARKGYRVQKVEFVSEPGIYIPAWVFLPERRNSEPVILWVSEAGKEAEGREFGALEKLARKGNLVVAVDVRGIGETAPQHPGPSDKQGEFSNLFDVEAAISYMAWWVDESLFGMRVLDVVRSVDYALGRPDAGGRGLRAIGKGAGALWVLYAAALDPRITETVAQGGLVSYRELAQSDRYTHGAGIFVRDVLLRFDLPQVAAAVGDRSLTLISPVDHMKRPVDLAAARALYGNPGSRFQVKGGSFEVD